jgi:hypothetical protein
MNIAFPLMVSIAVARRGGRQHPLELDVIGGHVGMRPEEVVHRQMPGLVPASYLCHVYLEAPGPFLRIPKEMEIQEPRVEHEQIAESLQKLSTGPHWLDHLYVDVDIGDRLRCWS